jgi:hypothetical protein
MSKLLWSFSSIDNRIAPLVFVIRRWAREASITQSAPGPWFSNFQMTLLVLFYCQSVGIVPRLDDVRGESTTGTSTHEPNTGKALLSDGHVDVGVIR